MMDTSAYSALNRQNPAIQHALEAVDEIYFSPVTLGELLAGFRGGTKRAHNERELHAFLRLQRATVASITAVTADRYAEIAEYLRTEGRPIPTNDIWIAASAMEHGLRVLTMDVHFGLIPHVISDVFPVS